MKEISFSLPEEAYSSYQLPHSDWDAGKYSQGLTVKQAFEGFLATVIAVSIGACGPRVKTPIPGNYDRKPIATFPADFPDQVELSATQTQKAYYDALDASGNIVTDPNLKPNTPNP